jgi:hypothetical protein
MRRAANHCADVPGRKRKIARVAASDLLGQRQAGARMDNVVELGDHVEQRAFDARDVDRAPADFEFATRELVALEDPAGGFLEDAASATSLFIQRSKRSKDSA